MVATSTSTPNTTSTGQNSSTSASTSTGQNSSTSASTSTGQNSSTSASTSTGQTSSTSTSTTPPNVFTDPMYVSMFVICLTIITVMVYYVSLGNGSSPVNSFDTTATSGASTSEVGLGTYAFLGVIIIIACLYAVYYVLKTYYGYDITTQFFKGTTQAGPEFDIDFNQTNETTPTPTPAPAPTPAPPSNTNEVFNIPDNVFDYSNANAICKAFGAELATYDQIENAYQNGSEWGNYGWSAGQMAFFPTQKETYDTLQTIPGHEHDRGRIGINGGYIANPEVRFGANCYGQRPAMTYEDKERMMDTVPYPQTAEEVAFDNKVDEWKGYIDEIIVSPFNNNQWSEYN
jgi:hypothetical protein